MKNGNGASPNSDPHQTDLCQAAYSPRLDERRYGSSVTSWGLPGGDEKLKNDSSQADRCGCTRDNATHVIQDRHGAADLSGNDPPPSAFAHIVWGWDAFTNDGTGTTGVRRTSDVFQPLQIIQNLSLCGGSNSFGVSRVSDHASVERNASPGSHSKDPFESIVLRHSHSSPIQNSAISGSDSVTPCVGMESLRRSTSTPSSSDLRERSRYMPCEHEFSGLACHREQDDRSAFSLPRQRRLSTSLSDSGVRYSAFDPVPFTTSVLNSSTSSSVEVVDVASPHLEECCVEDDEALHTQNTQSRDSRFLGGIAPRGKQKHDCGKLAMRSSNVEGLVKRGSTSEEKSESLATHSSVDYSSISDSNPVEKEPSKCGVPEGTGYVGSFSNTRLFRADENEFDDDIITGNGAPDSVCGIYHQLGSDIDEQYENFQGVEASVQIESPRTLSSPAYHQFLDDHVDTPLARSSDDMDDSETAAPFVRIQVSTSTKASQQTNPGTAEVSGMVMRRERDSNSLTPTSHDSGTQSAGTLRSTITNCTSGHTTQATSTSATVSSDQITALSSVNEEADREVRETNKAGKLRRRQTESHRDVDGGGSTNSSSTASTSTMGYLSLSGSPASLRDGACLPVDRFFAQSVAGFPHSNPRSFMKKKKTTATVVDATSSPRFPLQNGRKPNGPDSPVTVSSSSMANTTSSVSTGEEPPKFVSYLDCHSPRSRFFKGVVVESTDEPAERAGFGEISPVDSATKHLGALRSRTKDSRAFHRLAARPPRSPVKFGSRTLMTPPPASVNGSGAPDPTSPAYQQLSPPRKMVDSNSSEGIQNQRNEDVSRPHVFRSKSGGNPSTLSLVTPEDSACGSDRRSTGVPCSPVAIPFSRADIANRASLGVGISCSFDSFDDVS